MSPPDFPFGGLIILGSECAFDGHGVILNPTPAGRCSFAPGDTRTWTTMADIMAGVCKVGATYRLTPGEGHGETTARLCADHARHALGCRGCSRWLGSVETFR